MPEFDFDPKNVGFAVITSYPKWYRGKLRSIKHTDKVRGDLALEFVQKVSELGYKIVVSDGKSAKTFRSDLLSIPNIIVLKRKTKSSGEGKRVALDRVSKISGVIVIVLVEPEKVSFVTQCLSKVIEPILKDKAEIVIPKREDSLFKSTYPRYMYDSEVEGNRIYNEALRANGLLPDKLLEIDTFFGPRVFKNDKKIIGIFKNKYHFSGISLLEKLYDPDIYSNVQYFPIINALRKKIRIESVEVPFSYPSLQKENEDIGKREEFIAKRSMQRVSILVDLMHFLSFIKKNKNSHVRVID